MKVVGVGGCRVQCRIRRRRFSENTVYAIMQRENQFAVFVPFIYYIYIVYTFPLTVGVYFRMCVQCCICVYTRLYYIYMGMCVYINIIMCVCACVCVYDGAEEKFLCQRDAARTHSLVQ